jgi:hypothetical protein
MTAVIIIAAAIVIMIFPTLRCAVFNLFSVVRYGVIDLYYYFKHKKANNCGTGELLAYVGLFGRGKTLSVVHRVVSDFRRYNDKPVWCKRRNKFVTQKIKVLSNVDLQIPYERFVSLEQVIRCAETNPAVDDENDTLTVTLVLGDEFSVQMNSRNFKHNIDPLFLNTLLTCRHYHISLFYTAQRFGHVDALLRQVTSFVISCDKLWRFQRLNMYNAWEMENAANPALLRPMRRSCWFVRDRDYAAYDTYACVGNLTKSVREGDMMSAEEILALQCNNAVNMEAVEKPSRRWLRNRNQKARR